MKRPQLAKTLRKIANSTDDIFYKNEIAQQLLKEIQNEGTFPWPTKTFFKYCGLFSGGIITADDFSNYNVKITPAFESDIREMKFYSGPLPSSGPLYSFIMRVMSQYNDLYPDSKYSLSQSVLYYHRLIEVFKHTYSQRASLGDPDFDNVDELMKKLTSDKYVKEIMGRIDDKRTFEPKYYGEGWSKDDKGTADVAVVDQFGNAVSVTSSVNG